MTRRPARKGSGCPRCGGTGRIDAYSHVAYGACFACGGSPDIPAPPPEPRMSYAECVARYGQVVDELVALSKVEAWMRADRRTACEVAVTAVDDVRRGLVTDPAVMRRLADRCRRELRLEGLPLPRLVALAREVDRRRTISSQ
ncbi:hypothetical protein [Thermomonospora cellulosilytica]|uniref:Uncharacterized protein n=1 Tax=Thermomonospora cellulosilytica TaxID=1411118 RepID=A0A7W3N1M7_9ACTN|nr:hypothetical protein [Thermomonospora cellulosilytica]MBA9005889.1 hypothetical protein [Thermomonospora cellulosilytica]